MELSTGALGLGSPVGPTTGGASGTDAGSKCTRLFLPEGTGSLEFGLSVHRNILVKRGAPDGQSGGARLSTAATPKPTHLRSAPAAPPAACRARHVRADLTLPTPRPGDTDQPQFTEEESQASKGNLVFSAARNRARPVWHRTRDRTRDALSNPGTNSARSGWRIRPTDTGVEAQGGAELSLYRTTGGKSTARFPELPRRPRRQTAVGVIGKSPVLALLRPATPSGSLVPPPAPVVPSAPVREAVPPGTSWVLCGRAMPAGPSPSQPRVPANPGRTPRGASRHGEAMPATRTPAPFPALRSDGVSQQMAK